MTIQMGQLQQIEEAAHAESDEFKKYILLRSLGDAYLSLKDFSKAIDFYKEALSIAHEIHNYRAESTLYGKLANVFLSLGDLDRATDFFKEGTARTQNERIEQQPLEFAESGTVESGNSIFGLIEFAELSKSLAELSLVRRQRKQLSLLLTSVLSFLSIISFGIGMNLIISNLINNSLTPNTSIMAIITIAIGAAALSTGLFIQFMRKESKNTSLSPSTGKQE